MSRFATDLLEYFRDLLIVKAGGENSHHSPLFEENLSLEQDRLFQLIDLVTSALPEIKTGTHPKIYAEITGNSNNYGLWSDADYDAVIAECTTGDLCTDPEGRWEAMYDAESIVLEQAAIFPLYGQCNAEMISSAVTGVDFHPVALNRVFKDAKKSV